MNLIKFPTKPPKPKDINETVIFCGHVFKCILEPRLFMPAAIMPDLTIHSSIADNDARFS